MKKRTLAVLTSHPIQYQAPLFMKLAEHPNLDLIVYFESDHGAEGAAYDKGFGRKVKWDIPLLEGYRHVFLGSPFGIVGKLRRRNFDAILVYGWNSFFRWVVFAAAFLTRTPVFLIGESPLNQELQKRGIKQIIKSLVLKFLFRRVSAFLYIGSENKKFYKHYGVPEDKLFFTPYAVDNERFINEARRLETQKKELKKWVDIVPEQIVVLFVGKLIGKKKPFDLLKAFELLTTHYPLSTTTALVFVGDGVLRSELGRCAKERNLRNVHFFGFKNQTELPRYYAMADIFVLPSGAGESWGLAVNEAMCFGLPIIVSDIVGCGPDLVKENENGFVFPVGDIDALADYLRALVQDGALRRRFGAASRKIISNYSFEKDIEGILKAASVS